MEASDWFRRLDVYRLLVAERAPPNRPPCATLRVTEQTHHPLGRIRAAHAF